MRAPMRCFRRAEATASPAPRPMERPGWSTSCRSASKTASIKAWIPSAHTAPTAAMPPGIAMNQAALKDKVFTFLRCPSSPLPVNGVGLPTEYQVGDPTGYGNNQAVPGVELHGHLGRRFAAVGGRNLCADSTQGFVERCLGLHRRRRRSDPHRHAERGGRLRRLEQYDRHRRAIRLVHRHGRPEAGLPQRLRARVLHGAGKSRTPTRTTAIST